MGIGTASSLGESFATALAARDFARLRGLLAPVLDFRGLTPRRTWEASTADAFVDDVASVWFGPSDVVEEVLTIDTGTVGDREHVAYRFRVRTDGEPFVVEQQAYFNEHEGRIDWLRILCSGFRPA
jgi:hypothetical protein